MSEEFEDISVATTEIAPSEGVSGGAGGFDAPVMPVTSSDSSAETTPSEVQATQVNLDAGDESLKQNSQQAYLENYAPERAGGSAPITAGAIAAKEEEKEEKHAKLAEHLADQEKQAERQREWMERQHEFGGMKISGHDLDKLMSFYGNNPQMMDKLKERMVKSGMPKDKVDKGMKEFQEFMDLKKKEQEGQKLSEDEQRRLREIQKSEEFKKVAEASVQQARDNGIDLKASKESSALKAMYTEDYTSRREAVAESREKDVTTETKKFEKKAAFDSFAEMQLARTQIAPTTIASTRFDDSENTSTQLAAASKGGFGSTDVEGSREKFASAPHLTSEFSTTVAAIKPPPTPTAANDLSFGDDTAPVAVVAQTQLPKKIVTADVSFG